LLTTGDPNSPTGGLAGDPTTVALFGTHGIDYGAMSGGRVAMGYWLDNNRTFGIEGNAFMLERKVTGLAVSSNDGGFPLLAMPTQNPNGSQNAFYISAPAGNAIGVPPFKGRIDISSSTQLWGAEANTALNLWRGSGLSVDALAGFRYLDLQEDLQDRVFTTFIGIDSSVQGFDRFNTRDQFYGGQVGTRIGYNAGPLSANLTALVAPWARPMS